MTDYEPFLAEVRKEHEKGKMVAEQLIEARMEDKRAEVKRLRELVANLYDDLCGEVSMCWMEDYQKQMVELGFEFNKWGLLVDWSETRAPQTVRMENKELRELARDMWSKNLGRMDNPCSWCVMGCAGDDCDFERRMGELEIEVD